MLVMQVPVVQVVGMAGMQDGAMTATRAVLMLVPLMRFVNHDNTSPCECDHPPETKAQVDRASPPRRTIGGQWGERPAHGPCILNLHEVDRCTMTIQSRSLGRTVPSLFPPWRRFPFAAFLLAGSALAADKSVTMKIAGWYSKGDAFKTEDAVHHVKGVKSAKSDFDKKELAVVFDDRVATQARVEAAIVAAGYEVGR
jgi:copper chaperone CopZ